MLGENVNHSFYRCLNDDKEVDIVNKALLNLLGAQLRFHRYLGENATLL